RAHVESVQVLREHTVDFDFGHDVQRAGRGVDHGCTGDSNFGRYVAARDISAADRGPTARDEALLPVDAPGISVNCIDTIVLGRREYDPVRGTRGADIR